MQLGLARSRRERMDLGKAERLKESYIGCSARKERGEREMVAAPCKDVATEAMAHGSSNFRIMSHSLNKVQRVRLQNI